MSEAQLFYLCNTCFKKGQQYEFYFCDNITCNKGIQCIDCVKETGAGSFCPFCLFEVTSSSAKSERNHCPRNCFYCPCCLLTPLMLVNSSTDPSDQVPGTTYSLLCSICGWDSFADSSIILDRPTGLGGL